MNDSISTVPAHKRNRGKLSEERLGGWRQAKDTIANVTITAGGMAVLFAILLIFFYLLYEIVPLFKSASLNKQSSYSLQTSGSPGAKPLYLAMEEQAEMALQVDDYGLFQFFDAATGDAVMQQQLAVGGRVNAFAFDSEQSPLMAFATGGDVLIAKPGYKISYPNDKRLITPEVEFPYQQDMLTVAGGKIDKLALRDNEEQLLIVASVGNSLQGLRLVKEEDFLSEEIVLVEERLTLPIPTISVDWLMIGPDQRWLYVVSADGEYEVISLRDETIIDSGRFLSQGKVTTIRFLLGGISLMVADDSGQVQQWFMVRRDQQTPQLKPIRNFRAQASTGSIALLAIEHRRKGFITVDENNQLALFHSTSGRQLLSQSIGALSQLAIAPRANALLTQNDDGQFHYWQLHNDHPEISWSALWHKVWYESYTEPDYIWQSSASNNDFEAKYSFAPLAFGTLKAAFYAMIIATPLAICGAIYTAYFMTPGIRRKVKPLIELMEALPTVILGFLAGLWLAPFFERNLPGVFSIFLMMPVGVLIFAYCWSRLPAAIRLRVPDGWHAVLLVPVVIFVVWASVASSGQLELWFFNGDMRSWLTHDMGISFDQRNALVVGVAMGFAVVPTIFSIAEDAIFSVPKSLSYGSLALGATSWQTLVGVVIPTASPGIFSALMIGMGRAVGETMIVLMATGNTPVMDVNIFEGMRTLAANIAVEIGETEVDSSHFRVLFLAAFVLFLFTFIVNTIAEIVRQRLRRKYGSL
ncbi:MAG: phosphate transport system permease protein [Oceanicoccus sp.]|jgi:phosphate transport system permease protein